MRVSIDMAQRLAAAGIARAWQVGDWVAISDDEYLVVWAEGGRVWTADGDNGPAYIRQSLCLWLPTADDLMAVLEAEGWHYGVTYSPDSRLHYAYISQAKPMASIIRQASRLPEALAAVWLAAHKAEGGEG